MSIAEMIVFALSLMMNTASAQELTQDCAKAEARLLGVETKLEWSVLPDATPKLEIASSNMAERKITLFALGPILDAMDSPAVRTRVECIKSGVRVVATISRSEHYTGATAQNQLWRPKISVEVTVRSSQVVFESAWEMQQLPNGKEVHRARTPPYPAQKYPITVTKTLRSTSDQK